MFVVIVNREVSATIQFSFEAYTSENKDKQYASWRHVGVHVLVPLNIAS